MKRIVTLMSMTPLSSLHVFNSFNTYLIFNLNDLIVMESLLIILYIIHNI